MSVHSLEALLKEKVFCAGHYDVVVIGAGHAGCEAAAAASRLGCRTALFTLHLDALANMPCNPNIGGTAKGQLVREIDALGGIMGQMADQECIQFRMLNQSKGPAVLSPRAQQDRTAYQRRMKAYLEQLPNLDMIQGEIASVVWRENPKGQKVVEGVRTTVGTLYTATCVILATGTFLMSRVIIGDSLLPQGPDGLPRTTQLSDSLREMGLTLKRFKTGTPPRFHKETLDFSQMELQEADPEPHPFSYVNEEKRDWQPKASLPCYLTWSSEESRQLIEENIHRSPLYSGVIEGIGPRYCPSFEDKIVKFPTHGRHHIFMEPTGLDTQEYYASGLSSSMPEDIQRALMKTIPGLEKAHLMRLAYAIEYDLIESTELNLSLESCLVSGLFSAGQINGSSGYEEAACQGLMAGINAARKVQGKEPVILDRSQGYLGVLIDDLVTKGTQEPYRLMTSRAEYRLAIRQDNADWRLTPTGYQVGLISQERWERFQAKWQRIQQEVQRLKETPLRQNPQVRDWMASVGTAQTEGSLSLADLLRRPEISIQQLRQVDPNPTPISWPDAEDLPAAFLTPAELFEVSVMIKYEGYIRVENERIAQFRKMEAREIPENFPYDDLKGLKIEAIQKLKAHRPRSIGQAGRISGVSPADLAILTVALTDFERRSS